MACLKIHDLDLVWAVDDRIETMAVLLKVVSYIPQLFELMRVLRTVPVAVVGTGFKVDIVQSGFVRTHIAFAEYIQSPCTHHIRDMGADSGIDHFITSAAPEKPGA